MSGRDHPVLSPADAMQRAVRAHEVGNFALAERLCSGILAHYAEHFEALNLLGVIKAQTRRSQEAAALLEHAVAVRPGNATTHNNYANVLGDLGRFHEALEHYDRALALEPDYPEACNNRGGALRALGRLDAALASYEHAIALRPTYAEAHYNRGVTLHDLGRLEDGLECYGRALRLSPGSAQALYNQGIALHELGRLEEALHSYGRALQITPTAEAHNNRGNVLLELGRRHEALQDYERALQLNAALPDAHHNRGNVLQMLRHPEEALASFERALQLNPQMPWLFGAWLHVRLLLCDWRGIATAITDLTARITRGQKATRPFTVLAVSDALAVQRRAAEISAEETTRVSRALPALAPRAPRPIIRVGYYSADFRNHAMAQLMAGVFELHDRRRVELTAFSFGSHEPDRMTERLRGAFDRFLDVRSRSDREVAQVSRELEIDIAVDLMGYTQNSRPGVFAHRAAPLQVSYLGYAGTMGAPYIDYIVADRTVIPPRSRHYYSERTIYLPNSYFPNSYRINNNGPPAADAQPSRSELGLPAAGFVFCCFNSTYKIIPGAFESWMRILESVCGSVLWLLTDNATAARNLRLEAERFGIDGARLLFAPPVPLAQHLPRYRAADLFLDTHPCGAHTTACDALWVGLPVLTRSGESLAARVAASLLTAIGLPELITSAQEDYEALAITLATDPPRLRAIRSRLAGNRMTTPLFDTGLLTRHLETGYMEIYRRHHAGLRPDDVFVE